MSVLTPHEVEQRMVTLLDELDESSRELAQLLMDEARADVAYKREWAKALLKSDGKNETQRRARADLEVMDLFERWRIAKALCDACKSSVAAVRDRLSGTQSLGRSVAESLKG